MMSETTIGVSGQIGSFSEEAALRYAKKMNIMASLTYLIDMESVLAAVEEKTVEIGIFPVVNLYGGLVKPAFEAMGKHLFTPIDELWLDVKQCLLVLPGTGVEQIKKIVSHTQALSQCKNYLKNNFSEAELIPWIDTAQAAKELSEGKFSAATAVIAPARSAEVYCLDVMAENIQDNSSNLTAFIIEKKRDS